MSNNIRKIRKLLKISPEEFAKLLNCSVPQIYALEKEIVKIDEDWKIKLSNTFKCSKDLIQKDKIDEHDLQEIKNNYYNNITYQNSIINQNQTNCINYNNLISINFYSSIDDFSKNKNSSIKQCDQQLLQLFTGNKQITDFSKIAICCQNDKTLIIDTTKTTINENKGVYVIKNEIDANNSTCFVAEIKRNVLNNKIIMKLEDGTESEFLNTCTILGEVIKSF